MSVVAVESPLLHVSHNADNLCEVGESVDLDPFPDRIFSREVFVCEHIVDDDYCRQIFVVVIGKKSSALQRNPHGLQVARFYDVINRPVHVIVVRRLRLTFQQKQLFVISAERTWFAPPLSERWISIAYRARSVGVAHSPAAASSG